MKWNVTGIFKLKKFKKLYYLKSLLQNKLNSQEYGSRCLLLDSLKVVFEFLTDDEFKMFLEVKKYKFKGFKADRF